MRDLNRIYKITNLINSIWLTCPDMRYFQLMDSIKAEHNKLNNIHETQENHDLFYLEDDKFQTTLQTILSKGFSR